MKVDILIPSINKNNMLNDCLESIYSDTVTGSIVNFDIYVCVPDYIRSQIRFKVNFVERSDTEAYNFSKFINRLVRNSKADLLCLLNDDTQVLTGYWLYDLANKAQQPDVGVAGAKLLYPDNKIQHVGCELLNMDSICECVYQHAKDYPDAIWNTEAERTAIGAAACIFRRQVFNEVGGYDETLTTFDDIDFSLKARELGYRNFCVPTAVLRHYESVTRGKQLDTLNESCEIMRKRWGHLLA
jgi:GT2 family glycosyltransferase